MEKFRGLRRIAKIFNFLGYASIIVFPVIAFIENLLWIIVGFFFSMYCFGVSELIPLLMKIELNTSVLLNQPNQNQVEKLPSADLAQKSELNEKEKSEIFRKWREDNPKKPIEDFFKYMGRTYQA